MPTDDTWADPREIAQSLIADGRAADAVLRFQKQIEAGRGGILTRLALATALQAAGDIPAAINAAREATHLAPDAIDVLMAFGDALYAGANMTAAIAEYQRAARIAPDDPRPQLAIARVWMEIGEWDKALEIVTRAAELGASETAAIQAQIAAAQQANRLPQSFVRHLFDQFSADYDERMLQRLGYAAPTILRELASLYWGPKPAAMDILDLGCGTGLAARAFADCRARMVGIDLSPKMLTQARTTGLYQELIEADIEIWLATSSANLYDAVIAADVLVYLGDLQAVFSGIAKVLRPGAIALLTVERGETGTFALGTRRRYKHSDAYMRHLAVNNGLDVASLIPATLRYDGGNPVEGLAGVYVKT